MSILVVSVSHKSTSVAHLAQLAMDAAASAKLADQLVSSGVTVFQSERYGRRIL